MKGEGGSGGGKWVWLGWGGGVERKCRQLYLNSNKKCLIKKYFYFFRVIIIWVSVPASALGDPASRHRMCVLLSVSLPHQHSGWLAVTSTATISFMTFIASGQKLGPWYRLLEKLHIWMRPVYLLFLSRFSYNGSSKNQSCPNSLICSLGTWSPCTLLPTVLLPLTVPAPGRSEVDVPWWHFVGSFLIAPVDCSRCHRLTRSHPVACGSTCQLEVLLCSLTIHNLERMEKTISIIIC